MRCPTPSPARCGKLASCCPSCACSAFACLCSPSTCCAIAARSSSTCCRGAAGVSQFHGHAQLLAIHIPSVLSGHALTRNQYPHKHRRLPAVVVPQGPPSSTAMPSSWPLVPMPSHAIYALTSIGVCLLSWCRRGLPVPRPCPAAGHSRPRALTSDACRGQQRLCCTAPRARLHGGPLARAQVRAFVLPCGPRSLGPRSSVQSAQGS